MKKIRLFAALLALTLTLTACGKEQETTTPDAPEDGGDAQKEMYVIGISQYGEHASLDNCREGFLQGLEQAGLVEGVDFTYDYQNAGFDDNIATQIGQSFSAQDVDLMVGIATNSAVACFAAAEDKDIPVIFTAITDPVQAKLDSGNITGTSDKLPVEAQLDLIRQLQPNAKTIGIIYTTSEPNSVAHLQTFQELAPDYGFTIETVGITNESEVASGAAALVAKGVDCVNNFTDNNVVNNLSTLLHATDAANIPVFGSEEEQVRNGCVASESLDYVALGAETGRMAASVLSGEADIMSLPVAVVAESSPVYSTANMAKFGITLPADYSGAVDLDAEA